MKQNMLWKKIQKEKNESRKTSVYAKNKLDKRNNKIYLQGYYEGLDKAQYLVETTKDKS